MVIFDSKLVHYPVQQESTFWPLKNNSFCSNNKALIKNSKMSLFADIASPDLENIAFVSNCSGDSVESRIGKIQDSPLLRSASEQLQFESPTDTGESERPSDNVESEEERIAREIRESEAYAWELMRQESMSAYQQQLQYMQENADGISAEDMEALQQAMREADPGVAGADDDEEFADEDAEEDWSYDRLLALSEAIGGISG